jgi:hypothetical protein
MMKPFFITFLFKLISLLICSQTVGSSLPASIKKSDRFLFYLHGHIVTVLGNNAVQESYPEWGPYEYLNILDSLKERGFNVISERRYEAVADSVYIDKIAAQADTLLKAGVKAKNIIITGASAGWNIGLRVSSKLKNNKIRFVIMGGCWPDTYKEFQGINLYGHFLSIIESTDPHKTCDKIFEARKSLRSYREITLNTGLSHGFFYKGYRHWIDPVLDWFENRRK